MSTEIVIRRADLFPVGTLVRIYALSHPEAGVPVSGTPPGAIVAEATVAGTGALTYTELTQGVYYVAYASVAGEDRYLRFHSSFPAEFDELEGGIGIAVEGNRVSVDGSIAKKTEVAAEKTRAEAAEALKAPLNSPVLTGSPTAPTATVGDSTTRLATTQFATGAIATALATAEVAADEAREDAEVASVSALLPAPVASAATNTTAILAALTRASELAASLGVVVTLRPAQAGLYKIEPTLTKTILNPSGSSASYNVCFPIPNNVIVDGAGSTFQLQGSTEAIVFSNATLDNSARNSNIGLINAIADGRSLGFNSHSLLHFSYLDGFKFDVKIINSSYIGAWLYDVTKMDARRLLGENCNGQAYALGDPQVTGSGHNAIYDSQIDYIGGQGLTLYDTVSHPGNPLYLVGSNVQVKNTFTNECSGGIKIGQPSTDVLYGPTLLVKTGEATELQGAFKIQGNPAYPEGTDRPTRVIATSVIAKECVNMGLYLFHTQDCKVLSYSGYGNVTHDVGGGHADIFLSGNNNARVIDASSNKSNAAGLRVNNSGGVDNGSRIDYLKITNAAQNAAAEIKDSVRIDSASTIKFGAVELVDTEGKTAIGFNVTSEGAVGGIKDFVATGQTGAEFASNAPLFPYPGRAPTSPALAKRETFGRAGRAISSLATGTTGVLTLFGIELPKGLVVNNITFESGSVALATPTHWWYGLFNLNRVALALTADQATAAWAATTRKPLPVATTAGGGATNFVTTYQGLHYLGLMVAATTLPNLAGVGLATVIGGDPPILCGTADTGLTTPPAFPFTAAALTALATHPYAYVG